MPGITLYTPQSHHPGLTVTTSPVKVPGNVFTPTTLVPPPKRRERERERRSMVPNREGQTTSGLGLSSTIVWVKQAGIQDRAAL